MKIFFYSTLATALSALAIISVLPASLIFINNPEPPKELLGKWS